MAFAGWLFLAATYYLFIPIFHAIGLFIWLLIGFGWLWAALWSFTAVIAYISIASYVRAFAGLVLAVVIGTFLWNTDWPVASVKNMLWLRRGAFAEVAAAYERDQPVAVPAWMRSLAVDGEGASPRERALLPGVRGSVAGRNRRRVRVHTGYGRFSNADPNGGRRPWRSDSGSR